MEEEKAKAEKVFQDTVDAAQVEGEKMCTEMITVACKNSTEFSTSEEFCEEFFFFTTAIDDVKRLKRQNNHLYGSFYQKVTHLHHG